MKNDDLGTIGGKPVTQEMIEEFSAEFIRDWTEDEARAMPTKYGQALVALQSLDLTVGEIEALERRAKHEKKPLSYFVRSVLQEELAG